MYAAYISKHFDDVKVDVPNDNRGKWLKAIQTIPSKERRHINLNSWGFKARWRSALIAICESMFTMTIDMMEENYPIESWGDQTPTGWWGEWEQHRSKDRRLKTEVNHAFRQWDLLFLVPDAPIEVVRAAYRALSKLHHPDVGGDPNKFKAIADAYQEILDSFESK